MPEKTQPSPDTPPFAGDSLFRRMFSVFTVFSLAVAYGWLAGFVRQPDGDLVFHWRWPVPLWALAGLASTAYFWHKIWPPGNRSARPGDIVRGSVVLAVPGLWWLLFPLRSQSGEHFWEVVEGLAAAAIVLTFGAWMLIRLARAFEDDDQAN